MLPYPFAPRTTPKMASRAPANTALPDLLPALSYAGGGTTIDWNDISPRVSATYALDSAKKTIGRVSYARYAGQLNPYEVTFSSPVGGSYTYIAYKWNDLNHDGFAQKNEILTNLGPQYSNSIDPAHPTALTSPNKLDPNYHANHDNEVIVGLDHELMPNFSIGGAYTWRRTDGWPTWQPRIGLTQADYSVVSTPSIGGHTATIYAPNPALVDATGSGRITPTNRPDYHSSYNGFEFTLNKRLSNRWMARTALSINSWTEHYDAADAVQNPTRSDSTNGGLWSGPQVNGGQIAPRSSGSGKGDLFYNARWQFNANGFYQLPWDLDLGANVFGRQGYVEPLIIQASAGKDGRIRALATPNVDDVRYPNVWDIDFRLAKTFRIQRVNLIASGDLFNALNAGTVLQRTRNLSSAAFGSINEILAPRILRVGLKVQF